MHTAVLSCRRATALYPHLAQAMSHPAEDALGTLHGGDAQGIFLQTPLIGHDSILSCTISSVALDADFVRVLIGQLQSTRSSVTCVQQGFR